MPMKSEGIKVFWEEGVGETAFFKKGFFPQAIR